MLTVLVYLFRLWYWKLQQAARVSSFLLGTRRRKTCHGIVYSCTKTVIGYGQEPRINYTKFDYAVGSMTISRHLCGVLVVDI